MIGGFLVYGHTTVVEIVRAGPWSKAMCALFVESSEVGDELALIRDALAILNPDLNET
jgi:hypothetical protein